MVPSTVIGIGGFPDAAMFEYVLAQARGRRVLVDRTASPVSTEPLELPGELAYLDFYPWPPVDMREQALAADVILVCGGNTANMLAVWRVHGFDRVLREAWESGVVLTGWSAGMICWFEACVTDSFGPRLQGLRDGLGFIPGSACPHYDGEERRRPVYTELVANGFPGGIALDDAAAARFDGIELVEVVASTPTAAAIAFANATFVTAAVLLEDQTSRRYHPSALAWLLLLGPFELVLYRPILFWARAKGTWRYLRGDRGWHKFARNARA